MSLPSELPPSPIPPYIRLLPVYSDALKVRVNKAAQFMLNEPNQRENSIDINATIQECYKSFYNKIQDHNQNLGTMLGMDHLIQTCAEAGSDDSLRLIHALSIIAPFRALRCLTAIVTNSNCKSINLKKYALNMIPDYFKDCYELYVEDANKTTNPIESFRDMINSATEYCKNNPNQSFEILDIIMKTLDVVEPRLKNLDEDYELQPLQQILEIIRIQPFSSRKAYLNVFNEKIKKFLLPRESESSEILSQESEPSETSERSEILALQERVQKDLYHIQKREEGSVISFARDFFKGRL